MKFIAEFCQNHNGSFDILQRMVDQAQEGGATHGKIQTIFADDLSYREQFEQGQVDEGGEVQVIKRPYQPEYDRLKSLEITYEQHRKFVDYARSVGLEPLTTAFNLTCIPHIKDLGMTAVKVASYDCASLPLIEALTKSFGEIIVSTGASHDREIEEAAALLNKSGVDFSLLHCVTIYPTPLHEMHLARLDYLRTFTPNVGLSDHSLVAQDGVKAAIGAVHLGAKVIERHFTILGDEETKDGRVSITKSHLQELVSFSRLSYDDQRVYLDDHVPEFGAMIGHAERALSHEELLNRAYYRGRFCNKIDGKQVFNWDMGLGRND